MERGDVFHVDLNPIQGREQAGARDLRVLFAGRERRLKASVYAINRGIERVPAFIIDEVLAKLSTLIE